MSLSALFTVDLTLVFFILQPSSSRLNLSQSNIDSNLSNSNLQLNFAGLNLNGQIDPNLLQQQVIQQQVYQMQQRAFLASSLQQNLEIQKQLLQQNQQLQHLLAQTVSTTPPPSAMTGPEPPLNRSTSMSSLAYPLPPMSPIFQAVKSTAEQMTPSSPIIETAANKNIPGKISIVSPASSSNGMIKMIPPPPPPPPPPPLSPGTDVFGRAKTVRIGKWRWPPLSEEGGPVANANFIEFKRKKQIEKQQDKMHNSNSDSSDGSSSNAQRSVDSSNTDINEPKTSQSNQETRIEPKKGAIQAGAFSSSSSSSSQPHSRPDVNRKYSDNNIAPGSIGKLRISAEMRSKLEQLTIDQSVRGSKRDRKEGGVTQSQSMDDLANMNSVKKLSEQRKALLERQLMGSLRNAATFMETASTPNIKQTVDTVIVTEHIHLHKKLSQENSANSNPNSNYEPSSHVKKFIKNQQNILRKSGSREFRERREELGPFNRLSSSSIHVNYSDRPLYTPDRYFQKEDQVGSHNGTSQFDADSNSAESSSNNGRHSSSSGRFYNSHFGSPNQNGLSKAQYTKSGRMNIPPPPPPNDTSSLNEQLQPTGSSKTGRHLPLSRSQDRLSFDRLEFSESQDHFLKSANGHGPDLHNGVDIDESKQIKTKLYQKNELNFYAYSKPRFRLNLRKEV